jgi:CcmD family protein
MDERNFQYMFYGLSAAWSLVALYAVYLYTRSRKIRSEIDNLRKMVEAKEKK